MNQVNIMSIQFKTYILEDSTYKGGSKKIVMPQGIEVHKLSSNENPLGYSPKVRQALMASLDDLSQYPDNTDIRLRQALVKDFDQALSEDHFITTNSGSEIIDLISKAFLGEGDTVIVSQPCFLPYTAFTRWMGATAINVPMTMNFEYDFEGILKAISDSTKLVFLASPNNPSGTYIPKDVLEDFMNKVPEHVIVVLDEVYRHFAEVPDYVTGLPFVKQNKNIIAINSFSKTYGLAGLRIGYCYAPLHISSYIRKICKPFLLSTLALEGAIAALEDGEFVQETVDLVRKERAFVLHGLKELHIKYWPTQGNFVMIQPPISDTELVKQMEQKGIMVRPVGNFGAPGKVRISFGMRAANNAMLDALEAVIKQKEVTT
ncbi:MULTISPECIES: histidinol-phosphate transaminase [Maribacter]|uniref:histidinol-phosphate transaminase n=1 Tax=Maribacter flavus TaxID=1658664 RepID=A0ABU7IG62_9FLAO|nr:MULTISPECIES: histidinol-phosphate transaminase [Maribacter]MDC6405257.1 histidinol-phosphate transaminase [Maribacter sp. PR66]MEE1971934.1 histidinol-phosphate transaminase [Maribacter flavus]